MTFKNKKLAPYFEHLTKRSLYDGKVNTGGNITVMDSNWGLSFTIHRQPHFKSQKPNEIVVWIYALYSDTVGNYIKKKVVDCSGQKKLADQDLPLPQKLAVKTGLKKIKKTWVEELLQEANLI